MNLTDLGLTRDQEKLYRLLLVNPGTAVVEVSVSDPGQTLADLIQLGLVSPDRVALAPSAAVGLLIKHRIDNTTREIQRLGSAWDLVQELSDLENGDRGFDMVERIEGRDAINRRIREFQAQEETLAIKLYPLASTKQSPPVRNYRRRLAAGLSGRTIVPAASLADPAQLEYARTQNLLGDLHRITDEPINDLLVLDRKVAFVVSKPSDPKVALLVRQPGVVATLVELFDQAWRHARELDDSRLTEVERQVLHAMATHAKDDIAARSIAVSVRKYRGHVADLMSRVGAVNRFQLALRAREHGWL